ncbi:PspA/IM30 family protein [Salinibacterium sp. ZJ454]|uniref:PspA/IM30 family protein n=1 Tax=Salinibacterium sp. ZJ454 TaxID=2708339 RepID=UPI00142466D1|nr:PspA/IM30 family protein [Salinibacterium sp. ZJ454]
MSLTARLRTIFRSKSSRVLDRMEDPRDALDDSYDQQVKMLQQVRLGLAEVATAKKRIDLQGQEMGARYERLSDQAQEALNQGQEDLARTALERRALLKRQVATIRDQYTALQQQQSQLQDNERRLADRIAAFRTEKEAIKANYTASAARVRANEAAAGLDSQTSDVGASLNRAKDRIAQMQARADATDELLASGALHDLTAAPDEDLEIQLAAGAAKAEVDRQLQAMKNASTSGRQPDAGTEAKGPNAWLSIASPPTPPDPAP